MAQSGAKYRIALSIKQINEHQLGLMKEMREIVKVLSELADDPVFLVSTPIENLKRYSKIGDQVQYMVAVSGELALATNEVLEQLQGLTNKGEKNG